MSEGLKQQQTRFSLAGKIAVVTGGHRGIGRDISLGIARAGGDVVVIDSKGPCDSDVPSQLQELGRRYWSFTANLADASALLTAVDWVKRAVDRVDILVNNAGVGQMTPVEEIELDAWETVMNVNLRAPFLLAQAFASGEKGMLARGQGAIVNLSSVAGSMAIEGHAAYGASKAGLNMMTQVMTVEWAARGIRVNAVAPTVVLTEMGKRAWGSEEKGGPMRKFIPAQRFVEPFEVADAVVFLASDAASMINGEVVHIDGGMHTR